MDKLYAAECYNVKWIAIRYRRFTYCALHLACMCLCVCMLIIIVSAGRLCCANSGCICLSMSLTHTALPISVINQNINWLNLTWIASAWLHFFLPVARICDAMAYSFIDTASDFSFDLLQIENCLRNLNDFGGEYCFRTRPSRKLGIISFLDYGNYVVCLNLHMQHYHFNLSQYSIFIADETANWRSRKIWKIMNTLFSLERFAPTKHRIY